jgi:hypothetical protein
MHAERRKEKEGPMGLFQDEVTTTKPYRGHHGTKEAYHSTFEQVEFPLGGDLSYHKHHRRPPTL